MIIAFDPGLSTGVVGGINVDYAERQYKLIIARVIPFAERTQIAKLLDPASWIVAEQWKEPIEAIIIEDFMLYADKANAQINSRFETVKVIERITVYAEQLGLADKIIMQPAGLRLSAKGMQLEHRDTIAPNRHLTAAYQHLRYYLFMESQRRKRASE